MAGLMPESRKLGLLREQVKDGRPMSILVCQNRCRMKKGKVFSEDRREFDESKDAHQRTMF